MLKIIVNNVQHGDNFILQWSGGGVGIIDNHWNGNSDNPCIQFLEKEKIRQLDFILLTHPHVDHYSGLLNLLIYCEENNVVINRFMHTMAFTNFYQSIKNDRNSAKLITSSVRSTLAKRSLLDVLDKVHFLAEKGIITKVGSVIANHSFELSEKVKMNFLLPGEEEIDGYIKKECISIENEQKEVVTSRNNPYANLLCTLVQISYDSEWQVLFSSDCTKESLNRLLKVEQKKCNLFDIKTVAVQIPGHGSLDHHSPGFWNKLNIDESAVAFVSTGGKYKTPDRKAIEFFDEKFAAVHSTNSVNGYSEFYELDAHSALKEIKWLSPFLGGRVVEESKTSGEKHITISEEGEVNVETF